MKRWWVVEIAIETTDAMEEDMMVALADVVYSGPWAKDSDPYLSATAKTPEWLAP